MVLSLVPGGILYNPTCGDPLKKQFACRTSARHRFIVERCAVTDLYVGSVPGFPGAHSQGETLEELRANMREVIAMLLEDGEGVCESQAVKSVSG